MADTKISALTALAAPSSDDLLPIVDDPGGTPVSKKITIANAFGNIPNNVDMSVTATYDIGATRSPRNITATGTIAAGSAFVVGGVASLFSGLLRATNLFVLRFTANGVWTLANWTENDWTRLNLGGTTSSFPALGRSTTNLTSRLADGSDYAGMIAAVYQAGKGYTVSGLPTPTVGMVARVTDADTPAIGSTVTGGAAAAALVWYNGSNWTVIGV